MLIRRNHSCSTSDSAYSYTLLRSVVSLSVTFVHPACLNRSADLDGIWQVHLWGPMTHCVRWEARGDFGGRTHLANVNEERFRVLPN